MNRSDIQAGPAAADAADHRLRERTVPDEADQPHRPVDPPFRLPEGSGADAPVFDEPWQAQVFALAVALNEGGLFSWSEWAEALSRERARPGAAQDGGDYYGHWLAALEMLLARKGVVDTSAVDELAAAWRRAAQATPHGHPIRLENDPAGA